MEADGNAGCTSSGKTTTTSRRHVGSNPTFEQCYRGKVVPEAEWKEFLEAFCRDLPVVFRFVASHPLYAALMAQFEADFEPLAALMKDKVSSPEGGSSSCSTSLMRLPWLRGAWCLDLPKAVIRRSPELRQLHAFLKRYVELGALARQEAVSMIPAAMLFTDGCKEGLRVLDLCAAPGMKTIQMLDLISPSEADLPAALRSGIVIGNELDGRRCCMLAHHVLRLRHPCSVVMHHNATNLPPLAGQFDLVLCDVPCSGDGTMRKAPHLWSHWSPNRGSILHALQLQIASAGAKQLRFGGRMIYSTCSLQPAEDEAVVAELLRSSNGALELEDCSAKLPGLERIPGLDSWEVFTRSRATGTATRLLGPAEASARGLVLPRSVWPPEDSSIREMLPRALRFYPHRGNSGGFFVATFRRTDRPFPAGFGESSSSDIVPSIEGDALPEEACCKEELPATQASNWEAFIPVSSSVEASKKVEAALEFYGLTPLLSENLFLRGGLEGKHIYLVSDDVRDLLLECPDLRIMVAGVRILEENRFLKSSSCSLRLTQEGIHWLAPVMRTRSSEASHEDLLRLLGGGFLQIADFPDDSKLRSSLEELELQGSVAISCCLPHGGRFCLAAEKGAKSIKAFVNQHELASLKEAFRDLLGLPDVDEKAVSSETPCNALAGSSEGNECI